MKSYRVIYKNLAKIVISSTPKAAYKKFNIPKFDEIKLSFIGIGKENNGIYYMTPDEVLDLAIVCINFLGDNGFIKRKE